MKYIWIIMALVVVACTSDAAQNPTPPAADTSQADTTADVSALKRSEPLPPDGNFYNDPAALVGNTGSPQLVEFFTYW